LNGRLARSLPRGARGQEFLGKLDREPFAAGPVADHRGVIDSAALNQTLKTRVGKGAELFPVKGNIPPIRH
jgi:hypothetical protein